MLEIESGRGKPGQFWVGIAKLTGEIVEAVRGQEKVAVPGQTTVEKRRTRSPESQAGEVELGSC